MTTVYTKPECPQCDQTYKLLDKKGIPYVTINLMEHPESLERVRELGYMQAPVVVSDIGHWSGFRPDKIEELKMSISAATAVS